MSSTSRACAVACALTLLVIGMPDVLAEKDDSPSMSRYRSAAVSESPLISGNTQSACSRPDTSALQAIVPVATDHGSHATGVVYDNNRVLTAAHAITGGEQYYARIGDVYRSADLVMLDTTNDLAVLAVDTQNLVPLHIAGFSPALQQPVWAVGYPRAQAVMTSSSGVLQDSEQGALHTSASIESGQSGGGLLSCNDGVWELLGMLRGYGTYLEDGRYVKLPNHSVSVAAATINEFLLNF